MTVGGGNGLGYYLGKLQGGGTFTKIGTGTQTLAGEAPNTHTGLTKVNQGTLSLIKDSGVDAMSGALQIGDDFGPMYSARVEYFNDHQLPDDTDVTIHSGGVLDKYASGTSTFTLHSDRIDSLSGTGNVILGHLTVGGNHGSGTLSGRLSESVATFGMFTKIGAGTQTLSGASPNTHTGLTQVSDGVLQLAKNSGVNAMAGDIRVGDNVGSALSAELKQLTSHNIPDTSDVDVRSDGHWHMATTETINVLNGFGTVTLVGQLTVGGDDGTGSYSGVLQGNGTLTKIGTGTQSIGGFSSAANTYTGLTKVNEGKLHLIKDSGVDAMSGALQIGDNFGSADTAKVEYLRDHQLPDDTDVTIHSDGLLDMYEPPPLLGLFGARYSDTINSLSGTGKVRVGHLTVGASDGSGTFSGKLSDSGTFNAGTFTKIGTGTQTLSGSTSNSYSGSTKVTNGTLQVSKRDGIFAVSPNIQIGDGIGATGSAVLTQVNDNNFFDLSDVFMMDDGRWNTTTETVDEIAGGLGLINIGSHLTIGADDGSGVFFGSMLGGGALTKIGTGTQTLAGGFDNTHRGLTKVNSGTLVLDKLWGTQAMGGDVQIGDGIGAPRSAILDHDSDENMPHGPFVSISSDGWWDMLDGTNKRHETIAALLGDGVVTLGRLTVGYLGSVGTFTGLLEGPGTLIKYWPNTQTLAGSEPNTYTGSTLIGGGTLKLSKDPGIPAMGGDVHVGEGDGAARSAILTQGADENIPGTSSVLVRADGWWDLVGGTVHQTETIDALNGDVGAVVTLGHLRLGSGNGSGTYAGQLEGSGSITKLGTGTQTFAGTSANTNTGLTWINHGTIHLGKSAGVPALGGNVDVGDGAGPARSAILTQSANENLPDTSDVQVFAEGWWDLLDGTTHRTETIDELNGEGVVTLGYLIVGADGGSAEFFGELEGTGTFTKIGSGTQTLAGSGHNTHTGLTKVNHGTLRFGKPRGTRAVGGDVQVGDGVGAVRSAILMQGTIDSIPNTSDVQVLADVWWDLEIGVSETIDVLTGSGVVTVTSGHLWIGIGNGSGTFSGQLEGSGNVSKYGRGTQTLAGTSANTKMGLTSVIRGTLRLDKPAGVPALGEFSIVNVGNRSGEARSEILTQGANENLPDNSDVQVLASGWWDLVDGTTHRTETIGRFYGNGVVTLGHLTVGADNRNGIFSGLLEGSGTFTKVGNGTQTLTTANTYTGTTTVLGGTLKLDNPTGSATGTGPVMVEEGGVLNPGGSIGILNINNTLSFSPTSTLAIEVQAPPGTTPTPGEHHDQLNVTSSVTLDGTLDIDLLDPTTHPPLGTMFDVMTYGSRAGMFNTVTGSLIDTTLALVPFFNDTNDTLILHALILGDLNLDNKVTVADLSTFALNFNTTLGLYDELEKNPRGYTAISTPTAPSLSQTWHS